ncbi:MAG: hypothetical protein H7332_14060 [Bdellovibrionales bacterium]|nr:hypothetical protein [Ramlibacter sp.]
MQRSITITRKSALGDKAACWLFRPVQERLDALEELCNAYIQSLPNAEQRL